MSFNYPSWQSDQEPNQANIRGWLDNIYTKFQPLEQARWNQSHIDGLFYAGAQAGLNSSYYGQNSQSQSGAGHNYYFNLVQQPVNMVTGYQRQHRKSINYVPSEGADSNTTDQYTRLMTHVCNTEGVHEQFSRACEQAAIGGMVLLQPYLDYSEDAAQGSLKVKLWEYNSFLVDPFYRDLSMSDAQFVWCQEYISKQDAEERFPGKVDNIRPMMGSPQQIGRFYFLPENYNIIRNDLLVISYVWYKWRRKRKKLYSRSRNQFFDIAKTADLDAILYNIPDMEEVSVDVPCWRLAVVLNDQLMYLGDNPLDFDSCPFIPVYWNYDPHMGGGNIDLRVRSLIRPMRSPQYLMNYKIINNNDIAAATINAGWKRKSGAVANEDNLRRTGQGFDVIVNEGYEMTDVEKIIPSAVPESDLALAKQMEELIYSVAGINLENWSGQEDKQISGLTVLLKQAANLMVFQKYFDQWDYSLKLLGDVLLKVVLNNWSAEKVALLIGEEPTAHFYSKVFAKYNVIVEEGLLTATQRNFQAQQLMDINTAFGREVLPASMIIKDMNIQGKAEITQFLEQQEQQQSAVQEQAQQIEHAFEEAKLQELYSKAAGNLAMARERHGRSQSNLGLYEERLSEITRNRALATKDKMAALAQLVETIEKFGSLEATLAQSQIEKSEKQDVEREDEEKVDAQETSFSNEFVQQLLGQANQIQAQSQAMQGAGQEM